MIINGTINNSIIVLVEHQLDNRPGEVTIAARSDYDYQAIREVDPAIKSSKNSNSQATSSKNGKFFISQIQ